MCVLLNLLAALVSPWQDYVCLKEHYIANRKRHLESSRIAKADRVRCRDPMRGPQPHEAGLRPKSGLRRRCLRLRAGRSPTRGRHTAALFSLLRLCGQFGNTTNAKKTQGEAHRARKSCNLRVSQPVSALNPQRHSRGRRGRKRGKRD